MKQLATLFINYFSIISFFKYHQYHTHHIALVLINNFCNRKFQTGGNTPIILRFLNIKNSAKLTQVVSGLTMTALYIVISDGSYAKCLRKSTSLNSSVVPNCFFLLISLKFDHFHYLKCAPHTSLHLVIRNYFAMARKIRHRHIILLANQEQIIHW